MPIIVVDATQAHLSEISAIYAKAAAESHATFDLVGPSAAEWGKTLAAVDPATGNELLVALDEDDVLGFAKTGWFKERPGYASTRETSAYLHESHRGRGVGHALYTELLARLDRSGLRMAVAGVTQPNPASEALHAKHGFTLVGTFEDVGEKLGRPWSVRWYQRPLGNPRSPAT